MGFELHGNAGAGAHAPAGSGGETETRLVARFQAGVRALVRRHCRPNEPAVDDLVQDVLEAVLRAVRNGSVLDEQALPGYVRGTVVFTVQAYYRKRARRGEDTSRDVGEQELADHRDPQREAERTRTAAAVHRLLAELPVERDREILRRFYLHEQDREEVCMALGIEAGHFHRVLHRARERLRVLLREAGVEDAS